MTRRIGLVLVLVLLAAAGGAYGLVKWADPGGVSAPPSGVGGPFQLIDTSGKAVTEQDLLGRPTLMYFGFTYCPEVCPTTLTAVTQWLDLLGRDADRMNVVFVSLDPERDTPEAMKTYLSNFDPRIRGLTGTVAQVAEAAKAYRVFYRKVPTSDGSYTVDHSTAVYLFDAKGRFVAPIAYGVSAESAVPRLKELVR